MKSSTGASTVAEKTASEPVAVTEQSPGQHAAFACISAHHPLAVREHLAVLGSPDLLHA